MRGDRAFVSGCEAPGIFLPRRWILLDTVLVALPLVVASLHFIGAGHDDAWIMLFAGETVGRGPFLNHNLAVQEISTSVLGALLAAAVAPPGAEYVAWKIAAWLPALLAGIFFFRILLDHCGRWAAMIWLLVLSCFPNWHYWAWGARLRIVLARHPRVRLCPFPL